MADSDKKNEDNINSLCKKYFTPELCAEPVTESKITLRNNIVSQLIKFSKYLWGKTDYNKLDLPVFYIESADGKKVKALNATLEEAIGDAIGSCFKKWKEQSPNAPYTAYYKQAFLNALNKLVDEELGIFSFVSEQVKENERKLLSECEKKHISISDYEKVRIILPELKISDEEFEAVRKWRQAKSPSSLEEPVNDSDGDKLSLADSVKDENLDIEGQYKHFDEAKRKFDFIEKVFRMKKRSDWLKSIVTQRLFEDLHKFFEKTGISIERYTFIDKNVYALSEAPTQRDISKMTGKDAGQLSRAWDSFSEAIKNEWEKNNFD